MYTHTHTQNEAEGSQLITREYALYCSGRFVAMATGEHAFYSKSNLRYGKACESAKSNALMRCCKDLGVASELWDPQVITHIMASLHPSFCCLQYDKSWLLSLVVLQKLAFVSCSVTKAGE